jgi:hypothetical protein
MDIYYLASLLLRAAHDGNFSPTISFLLLKGIRYV